MKETLQSTSVVLSVLQWRQPEALLRTGSSPEAAERGLVLIEADGARFKMSYAQLLVPGSG